MRCEQIREWMSDKLDGCLDSRSTELLAEHLAACADCRRELDELRQTVALLRQVDPVEPPAGMVAAVRQRLQGQQRPAVWSLLLLPQTREAIAAGLLLVVGVYGWREMTAPREAELRKQEVGLRTEVAQDGEEATAELVAPPAPAPRASGPAPLENDLGDKVAAQPMQILPASPHPVRSPLAAKPAAAPAAVQDALLEEQSNRGATVTVKGQPVAPPRPDEAETSGNIWRRAEGKERPEPATDSAEGRRERVLPPGDLDDKAPGAKSQGKMRSPELPRTAAIAKGHSDEAVEHEPKDSGFTRVAGKKDSDDRQAADLPGLKKAPSAGAVALAGAPGGVAAPQAESAQREFDGAIVAKDKAAESQRYQGSSRQPLAITVTSKDTGKILEIIEKYTDRSERDAVASQPVTRAVQTNSDVVSEAGGRMTMTVRIPAAAYPEFLRRLESVGKLKPPAENPERMAASAAMGQEAGRTSVGGDLGFVLLQITIVPEAAPRPLR